MKIQYSLRTLVLMTFAGGIVVYFAIGLYMDRVLAKEMAERQQAIDNEIVAREGTLTTNGAKHQPNAVIYSERGHSSWDYWQGWEKTVRFNRDGEVPRCGTVGFIDRFARIFSMNIQCTRSRLRVEPIEIDYDDAEGNEELVAAIQKVFFEKKWPLVTCKVATLEK